MYYTLNWRCQVVCDQPAFQFTLSPGGGFLLWNFFFLIWERERERERERRGMDGGGTLFLSGREIQWSYRCEGEERLKGGSEGKGKRMREEEWGGEGGMRGKPEVIVEGRFSSQTNEQELTPWRKYIIQKKTMPYRTEQKVKILPLNIKSRWVCLDNNTVRTDGWCVISFTNDNHGLK